MTSGSSLQLPERGYSSKPRPRTLGSGVTSGRRPGLSTLLPDDPVHIHDARGRHATPSVENPVLVETYHHPRPDRRRAFFIPTLEDLLRLRVPVLYRDHSFSLQALCPAHKITTPPILFQSFACIAGISKTYTCELVSLSARRLRRLPAYQQREK